MANLINAVMSALFAARISGLPQVQYVLGILAMIVGFALGYIAFLNVKKKETYGKLYFSYRFSFFSLSNSFWTIFSLLTSEALP